MPKKEIWIC